MQHGSPALFAATSSAAYQCSKCNTNETSQDDILDIADLSFEGLQFFLDLRVLLGHLLKFDFPLVTFSFQRLDLALVVASLDICLAKPVANMLADVIDVDA